MNNENDLNPNSNLSNQANRVVGETKKLGDELYDHGKDQLKSIQDDLSHYSEQLTKKIHQKPLASVLWAAGIGFVLSKILGHK
ncbi:MAG: hypothetical protein H0T84_14240 [Tatlockia sp.]|nr:hypothetical protein [Tatlockia sp.]